MTGLVVHLIDDDDAVLAALSRLLKAAGYETRCHSSAESFLALHDDQPGCAIVDVGLPGLTGFDLQDRLASTQRARPLIFLTGQGDIPSSVRAMRAGAVDFLTKPVSGQDLLAAVALAVQRDTTRRADQSAQDHVALHLASLTRREREVLDQVIAGQLNKQIADTLGIAEKTIKVHRGRVMKKMAARSLAELVAMVLRHKG